jgi:hypothetical protein
MTKVGHATITKEFGAFLLAVDLRQGALNFKAE